MSMGTKDYNAIAALLKKFRGYAKTHREKTLANGITTMLADYMQSGNAQFSRHRFLEASAYDFEHQD